MILIPDIGEIEVLKDLLGKQLIGDLTVKLFVNDITPSNGDTLATYIEMSTLGYAPKTITPAGWTIIPTLNKALGTHTMLTWVFSAGAPVTIYGLFVVDSRGALRWMDRLETPLDVGQASDSLSITPRLSFSGSAG